MYVQGEIGWITAQKYAVISGNRGWIIESFEKGADFTERYARAIRKSNPRLYKFCREKAAKGIRDFVEKFKNNPNDVNKANDLFGLAAKITKILTNQPKGSCLAREL